MSQETLELFIRANVENLESLNALQARIAAVGAEAESLKVSTAANGSLNVSGSIAGGGLGDAANMAAQLEQAGVQVQGYKVKVSEASAAERSFATDASAAARAASSLGATGAQAVDRVAALAGSLDASSTAGFAMSAALAGGVIALGAFVEGSKSAIDNADQLQKSTRLLEQAYSSQGMALQTSGAWVSQFIQDNSRLIANQYEVADAIASATRSGESQTTVQRMAADALDLSAAKGVSYSEAMMILQQTAEGSSRGLISLGFNSKEVATIMGTAHGRIGDVNMVLDQLEPRIAGSAAAQSNLTQSTYDMNKSWQDFSSGPGAQLAETLAKDTDAVTALLKAMESAPDIVKKAGSAIEAAFPLTSGLGIAGLTGVSSAAPAGGGNAVDAQLASGAASGPPDPTSWSHEAAVEFGRQAAMQTGGGNPASQFNQGQIQAPTTVNVNVNGGGSQNIVDQIASLFR